MDLGTHIMTNVLGQGRENAKQFLKENTDIREEIAGQVREHHGLDQDRRANS